MGEPAKTLVIFAFVVLLVSGCTALHDTQQQGNGEQVLISHGILYPSKTVVDSTIPNTTKKPKPPVYQRNPDRSCNVTVSPNTIYAGESVEVEFSLVATADTDFTFICGDEERHITSGSGGFLTGIQMCRFNKPGIIEVWVKAENNTCARQNLTVKPRISDPRSCYIGAIEHLPNYTYNATVHYDGFGQKDDFVWFCDTIAIRKKIKESSPGSPLAGAINISCAFGSKPQKEEIEVFIGSIKCGGIPTNQ